jgi:hypothetical protein
VGFCWNLKERNDRFDSGRIVHGVFRIARIAAAVVFVFA